MQKAINHLELRKARIHYMLNNKKLYKNISDKNKTEHIIDLIDIDRSLKVLIFCNFFVKLFTK